MIPPILTILNDAFGFQGAPGAGPNALAAPQAALISAIAQGVLGGKLDWNLIGLGALIGVGVVIVDEVLRATKRGSLPPLAVGMGIYLPMTLTLLIPVGAFLGWTYDKWAERSAPNPEFAKRLGVLMATGLIVGESLFGVVFAAIVGATDNDAPLALVDGIRLGGPARPCWCSPGRSPGSTPGPGSEVGGVMRRGCIASARCLLAAAPRGGRSRDAVRRPLRDQPDGDGRRAGAAARTAVSATRFDYGAVSEESEGKWAVEGRHVVLTTDPMPPPAECDRGFASACFDQTPLTRDGENLHPVSAGTRGSS